MSSTVPAADLPGGTPSAQPWQPAPQAQAQPQAAYPAGYPAPAAPAPARGSILRRWPVWAQNTALIVGAVAVLAVVFFAGFFTGGAVDGHRTGFGTGQDFSPRQFGNGNGNGFGGSGNGSGNGGSGSTGNGFSQTQP